MERKSKTGMVISVCCIVWGVLYFLFLLLYPHSLYDVIGLNNLGSYSQQELDILEQKLTVFYNLIQNGALVLMILLLVLKMIAQKKAGYGFKEKSMVVYSTDFLIVALIIHLFGAIGVSWIFVIVSGVIGIIGSIKEKGGISRE